MKVGDKCILRMPDGRDLGGLIVEEVCPGGVYVSGILYQKQEDGKWRSELLRKCGYLEPEPEF